MVSLNVREIGKEMLSMRWLFKRNTNMDTRFRCFGCCHVKTGSICLGLYHLILQIMSIGFVLYFMAVDPTVFGFFDDNTTSTNKSTKNNMDFQVQQTSFRKLTTAGSVVVNFDSYNNNRKNVTIYERKNAGAKMAVNNVEGAEPLPTPLPETGGNYVQKQQHFDTAEENGIFGKLNRFKSAGNHLSLALLIGLLVITLMMVYGALKAKPLYILPYFGYQVFDFTITSLMAISYYSWVPNANEFLNNHPDFPFSRELSTYDMQWLSFMVLILYVAVLMVKAYFIGVVFACYQYCQLRSQGILTYQQNPNGTRTDAELLLPPSYENAVKMPAPQGKEEPEPEQADTVPPPAYQNVV